MARAIALRPDLGAPELRRLARQSKDAAQVRRLLALATIHDGGTRSVAARIGRGPIPPMHGVVRSPPRSPPCSG